MAAYRHALIVGKFAPFHRGHQRLLEHALDRSRRLTVMVYASPDFIAMPSERRARWIRQIYPDVDVRVPGDPPLDSADELAHRSFVRRWLEASGIAVDAVFSSEAYGPHFAAFLGVAHEMVDLERRSAAISGTQVRGDIRAHRAMLHPIVYNELAHACDLNARAHRR